MSVMCAMMFNDEKKTRNNGWEKSSSSSGKPVATDEWQQRWRQGTWVRQG